MQTSLLGTRRRMRLLAAAPLFLIVVSGCGEIEQVLTPERSAPSEPEVTAPQGRFLDEPSDTDSTIARRYEHLDNANEDDAQPGPPETTVKPLADSAGSEMPIRLSTGVALAQTLPTGTGMLFSVDCRFSEGGLNPSSRYVWVLQGRNGKSLRQAVQLFRPGEITLVVPDLRPEAGPFSSYIVEVTPDGTRRRVSRSIDMR